MFRITPETAGFNAATSPLASAICELVGKHKIDIFEMEESWGWTLAVSRLKLLSVVVRLHGP